MTSNAVKNLQRIPPGPGKLWLLNDTPCTKFLTADMQNHSQLECYTPTLN